MPVADLQVTSVMSVTRSCDAGTSKEKGGGWEKKQVSTKMSSPISLLVDVYHLVTQNQSAFRNLPDDQ